MTKIVNPVEGLGNQALLDKIDRLRELNVGSIIPLPQLIVVGDQSSGKIIDVPGIFRTPTPGLTSDSDITLVTSMVKRYMKDSRTIILAVIPCNIDIATQEILKLAKDADPNGTRTVSVLTKPDLTLERAMQQNILDLIQGKRQDLKLGYCVVKNRGADDGDSSLAKRDEEERAFFRQEPWTSVASSARLGIDALRVFLQKILMDITKKEFPILRKEIAKRLSECGKKSDAMGVSRSDEKSQRAYLGRIAANFERVVGYALNAYYTEDPIFHDRLEMRLITRIIKLNEVFSEVFSQNGHTRHFENSSKNEEHEKQSKGQVPELGFDIPDAAVDDLYGIIAPERFLCPEPADDPIIDHIDEIFQKSRGPELGTVGGALLGTIFKEQSRRWEDLVTSHVSDAIALVHHFIIELLAHTCAEEQVMTQLWDNVLLEKLQESYKRSMHHAHFLLEVEREGKPYTYDRYFSTELQKGQARRLQESLRSLAIGTSSGEHVVRLASLSSLDINRSNPEQVREYLHDILESYYKVSVKRFVDTICQQVIDHFLLNGKDSPLHVFGTDLVFDLSADTLEMVAGEDHATKQERESLRIEMERLEAAMQVVRG
ncbi:hypothetical protein KVR01_003609 [Diaporthe batatas]|uniref:uncharacterized protein n=1 Tax=Diaporthe batatas TaxID=748121 RepID=UPI001D03EB99|nr:uncharacterized protein KVR01_003609 [Diaporthe batatas]KAG8167920.1 hypothetical protein KVR01_003609 [Diaporthe batatas]